MKRKKYEKPSVKVVMLNQQRALLAGSGEQPKKAERRDYESTEWP